MQHSHTSSLNFEGHHALWRALKYLFVAVAGVLAVIELSPGMLIALSIAAGLLLAFVERTRKLETQTKTQTFPARLLGDGGSFPNDDPEKVTVPSKPATVLDGGSLEHHQI